MYEGLGSLLKSYNGVLVYLVVATWISSRQAAQFSFDQALEKRFGDLCITRLSAGHAASISGKNREENGQGS